MNSLFLHSLMSATFLVVFSIIPGVPVVFAQPGGGPGGGTYSLPNPLGGTTDILSLIQQVVTFLQQAAIPIVAAMIIYGAYQILFAGGDPEKFKSGRRTIVYAIVGYLVILIGWGLVTLIKSILSG